MLQFWSAENVLAFYEMLVLLATTVTVIFGMVFVGTS
jgi:hypothetical protein